MKETNEYMSERQSRNPFSFLRKWLQFFLSRRSPRCKSAWSSPLFRWWTWWATSDQWRRRSTAPNSPAMYNKGMNIYKERHPLRYSKISIFHLLMRWKKRRRARLLASGARLRNPFCKPTSSYHTLMELYTIQIPARPRKIKRRLLIVINFYTWL